MANNNAAELAKLMEELRIEKNKENANLNAEFAELVEELRLKELQKNVNNGKLSKNNARYVELKKKFVITNENAEAELKRMRNEMNAQDAEEAARIEAVVAKAIANANAEAKGGRKTRNRRNGRNRRVSRRNHKHSRR